MQQPYVEGVVTQGAPAPLEKVTQSGELLVLALEGVDGHRVGDGLNQARLPRGGQDVCTRK